MGAKPRQAAKNVVRCSAPSRSFIANSLSRDNVQAAGGRSDAVSAPDGLDAGPSPRELAMRQIRFVRRVGSLYRRRGRFAGSFRCTRYGSCVCLGWVAEDDEIQHQRALFVGHDDDDDPSVGPVGRGRQRAFQRHAGIHDAIRLDCGCCGQIRRNERVHPPAGVQFRGQWGARGKRCGVQHEHRGPPGRYLRTTASTGYSAPGRAMATRTPPTRHA